jgi:hypothetical protein
MSEGHVRRSPVRCLIPDVSDDAMREQRLDLDRPGFKPFSSTGRSESALSRCLTPGQVPGSRA